MKKVLNSGILLAISSALISGVSNVVNKVAVAGLNDPILYTTVKNIFVGFILVMLLVGTKKLYKFRELQRTEIFKLFAIALIGGSIPFALYFTALSHSSVITVSLIHKSLFLWVSLLAVPFLKEKIKLGHIVGIGLIVISNYFLGSFSLLSFGKYEWMALAATLCWAVEQIIAKKALRSIDPDIVTTARMMGGAIVLLIPQLFNGSIQGISTISFTQWSMIAITSSFLFLYVFTWYHAIRKNSVITVAVILTSATLVTNLLTGAFVTHAVPFQQMKEGLVLLIGIFVFLLSTKLHEHARENAN